MAETGENRDSARLPNADLDWNNPDILSTAKAMRSVNGGHLKQGSHHWYTVLALLRGEVIDDYRTGHGVLNDQGYRINNIRSRVPDLRRDWGMPIADRVVEGKKYKEYYLDPAWVPALDEPSLRARIGQEPPHPAPAPVKTVAPATPEPIAAEFDWEI